MHGRRAFVEGWDCPLRQGRGCLLREGVDSLSREGGGHLLREGEAIHQGKGPFVEGRERLLIRGGKLFNEAGEPISQWKDQAIVKGGGTAVHQKRKDTSHLSREGAQGHSSREGGQGHSLREGRGFCSLWLEGRTMNFCLGKFEIQWCWTQSFKFNGLEQIAVYDLKLFTQHSRWAYWKKMNCFKNSWHRHMYKRYDNVDTNLWLNFHLMPREGWHENYRYVTCVWLTSDFLLLFLTSLFTETDKYGKESCDTNAK